MEVARQFGISILRALVRSRIGILSMGVAYLVSALVGAVMAHAGNSFALSYRDQLVGRARTSDPASLSLQEGHRVQAALWDFSRNLLLGAVPDTVGGLAVVVPYPLAAHRGWVGGIVSVDGEHRSRLGDPREAVYYLVTLSLQLIPYTLAGGAGVTLGIAYLRPPPHYQTQARLLGLPREAVLDVLRIYALIAPLFLIASLWEFLMR